MIKQMVTSAVFAGFAVGLLVALLQFGFLEKYILLAEDYESGAKVHFQGLAAPVVVVGHDLAAMTAAEVSPLARHAMTVLFAGVIYVGYALLMVAAYAVAGQLGHPVTVQAGLLWGLAGFAVFQMAPAMGLPPELPGTPSADLDARQWWWLGTAVMTAAGLALLAFARGTVRLAGVGLLAVPQIVGAPELGTFGGVVPPELAGAFATRTLGIGLVAWVVMGGVSAWLWKSD